MSNVTHAPFRARRPWTDEEVALLEATPYVPGAGRHRRSSDRTLAEQLGRSPRAVQRKREALEWQAVERDSGPVDVKCDWCGQEDVLLGVIGGGIVVDEASPNAHEPASGVLLWNCHNCGEDNRHRWIAREGATMPYCADPDAGLFIRYE